MAAKIKPANNWRLVVFGVPDRLTALLMRYRFKRNKNSGHWHRVFAAKDRDQANEIRAELLAAGLRGKWYPVTERARSKDPLSPMPREVKSAGRLRGETEAAIIMARKENRLAAEALERAIENRRQADQLAQREVNERVRRAVLASKGEST